MTGADASAAPDRLRRRVPLVTAEGRGARVQRGLLVAGAALLPLGLVVILLGWLGASRTPWLFEQIPYLISGGLLGLGLAFTGGFLYFAYWLTRLVSEMRDQTERIDALIARLEARQPDAPAEAGGVALVTTPRGSQHHRPTCPIVVGRNDLRPVQPGVDAGSPCRICQPGAGRPAS